MHQFDLLYMPSDTLYGNKYKYILAGIDAASRYNKTNDLILNLIPENMTQHSRIE